MSTAISVFKKHFKRRVEYVTRYFAIGHKLFLGMGQELFKMRFKRNAAVSTFLHDSNLSSLLRLNGSPQMFLM